VVLGWHLQKVGVLQVTVLLVHNVLWHLKHPGFILRKFLGSFGLGNSSNFRDFNLLSSNYWGWSWGCDYGWLGWGTLDDWLGSNLLNWCCNLLNWSCSFLNNSCLSSCSLCDLSTLACNSGDIFLCLLSSLISLLGSLNLGELMSFLDLPCLQ